MNSVAKIFFEKRYKKTLILFGAVGMLLRIIFIPFTMHPDILWIHMCASKMAYHGILNIYEYAQSNFYDAIVKQGTSYYPPLAYYILGFFHFVFKQMLPNMGIWLDKYSAMLALGDSSHYLELFKIPFRQLSCYILLMKIPYLIFDLLCGFFLLIFFKKTESAIRAFKFWMINPVIIFGSYIFGQFDVLIAFFFMVGLFLISRGKPYAGIFVIGASSLLKAPPLLLILPLCLSIGKNFKEVSKLLVVAVAPIALLMLPFYVATGSYVFRSIFMKLIIGRGANIIDTIEFSIGKAIFLSGYLFVLYRLVFKKDIKYDLGFDVWRYISTIILLSYFIVYTPIHYFQWVVPFLIIGVVNNNIPRSVYIFQVLCLFVYAICSRPLSAQLFSPLNPDYLYNLKSLPEYINQFMKWGIVMRVARLLFYTCSLYVIWKILFKPEVKNA